MDSFLQVFGGVTIGQVIIFIMAILFIIDLIKKGLKAITDKHDEQQELEADHSRIIKLESEMGNINEKIDKLITGHIELERIRFKELYYRAKVEYYDYGFINMETAEDLELIYATYKTLGGNGNLEAMHNEVINLPRGKTIQK